MPILFFLLIAILSIESKGQSPKTGYLIKVLEKSKYDFDANESYFFMDSTSLFKKKYHLIHLPNNGLENLECCRFLSKSFEENFPVALEDYFIKSCKKNQISINRKRIKLTAIKVSSNNFCLFDSSLLPKYKSIYNEYGFFCDFIIRHQSLNKSEKKFLKDNIWTIVYAKLLRN